MDTTLRDGEQTRGVSFNTKEKLSIAKLLINELKVDRIEVGSARVSEGEFEAIKSITSWANENGNIKKIEALGFIDGNESIDWLNEAGIRTINLLSKGSLNHLQGQLKKTPHEHASDIKKAANYADSLGFDINLYLEDWSNGMIHSPDYVYFLVDELKYEKIKRIMLPDTLGILNHEQTYDFCKTMVAKYPSIHFDFHAHNDYDLSTANVFSAIKAGVQGIHSTVNGLGERAGNVPLSSIIGIIKDHLHVEANIQET